MEYGISCSQAIDHQFLKTIIHRLFAWCLCCLFLISYTLIVDFLMQTITPPNDSYSANVMNIFCGDVTSKFESSKDSNYFQQPARCGPKLIHFNVVAQTLQCSASRISHCSTKNENGVNHIVACVWHDKIKMFAALKVFCSKLQTKSNVCRRLSSATLAGIAFHGCYDDPAGDIICGGTNCGSATYFCCR